MKENFRKVLIVFVVVCFALTATDVILALHLAEHDKSKSHNPEKCPICQKDITDKNSAVLQSPSKVYQVNEIPLTTSYKNFFSPRIVKFQYPQLRAPPSVC